MNKEPLLRVVDVHKHFLYRMDPVERLASKLGSGNRDRSVYAVNGVSLQIEVGQIYGLVGESGCGKSTVAQMIAGIYPPTSGTFFYHGLERQALVSSPLRLKKQLIMQNARTALNPRKRVLDIITEAPVFHQIVSRGNRVKFAQELMTEIGLAKDDLDKFPHMFSGGQRQRINIARALALRPDFLICDEAVAALDVSIQAQILNLLLKIKEDFGLTLLFISHDLGLVHHICTKTAVMYLGKVVECGDTAALFQNPLHPYTQTLLAALPKLEEFSKEFRPLEGEVPSALELPIGCAFQPRCRRASSMCRQQSPLLEGEKHQVACFNAKGEN